MKPKQIYIRFNIFNWKIIPEKYMEYEYIDPNKKIDNPFNFRVEIGNHGLTPNHSYHCKSVLEDFLNAGEIVKNKTRVSYSFLFLELDIYF